MQLDGAADVPHKPHTMTLAVANSKVMAFSAMEKVFSRSEEAHRSSMEEIAQSLTFPKAMDVVAKSQLTGNQDALSKVAALLSGKQNLRKGGDDGFGGLDGARRLLNSMIHECMLKYDAEIAKCTDYYAKQCALMEIARGMISASNFVAATSRALILDAQYNINKCEISIPETKMELKDHLTKCKTELKKLNAKLIIVMNDIAIMTMILEMSDCDAKLLQQKKLAMLRCKNECTNKHTIIFNHKELQNKVSQLKSQE